MEGFEISRVSWSDEPNHMGHHMNMLISSDEVSNKASKPDFDTGSKPDIEITKCVNYLFNALFDITINPQSSNFA